MFGACVAVRLDEVWLELGRPDPFVVIEGGSGPGRLCRDVMLGVDGCREALRYVMVERSELQRDEAFARVVATCFSGSDEVPISTASDLPPGPFTGVVLANELLDNLPVRLLEQQEDGWAELYVDDGTLVPSPAPDAAKKMATALAGARPSGTRVPLQLKAAVWVRRALDLLEAGRVIVFDYGFESTAELADRPFEEWLRTYRSHRRAADPLADPGTHDITCDVAFDQLPAGAVIEPQARWLRSRGIESMVEPARAQWQVAASRPDAAAVAARSVLDEAAQLVAPDGLGGFLVAEWRVDPGPVGS